MWKMLLRYLQTQGENIVYPEKTTSFVQEFLAEGEETAAERRARLAREAEERERRRLAGEEEMMKQVEKN